MGRYSILRSIEAATDNRSLVSPSTPKKEIAMTRQDLLRDLKRYKIKQKSRWWSLVPLSGRNRFSATMGNTIYLTPSRWKDWTGGSPKNSTLALLAHETTHVDQFNSERNFKRNYVTSRKHRLRYEAEAYAKQIFVRMQLGSTRHPAYYIDRYAKLLSSKSYLLFMSYDTAYRAILSEYNRQKYADITRTRYVN